MTETDTALAVADDDERGKAEALAALHRLRHAVDVDELFDQLFAAILALRATIVAATAAAFAATTTAIAAAPATAGGAGVFGRFASAFGVLYFVSHH
jgi:hypothetical protein